MITIDEVEDTLEISIFGELALADYRQLEQAVSNELHAAPKVKMLIDVRAMTGFTVDVAWEEIKFTRAHAHDFRRIAVVTPAQWGTWLSWVTAAFTDAEVMLFDDPAGAEAWLGRESG
jgi:SpoIIAA-like